ncbi:MAG TPA: M13 family metallopeptidase [Rhizomicrobium sp.]|nr:M13 family metallopeptidase [Rhizomicrobium sp.]
MNTGWIRGALTAALLAGTTTLALAADKPIYGAWGLDTAGMDKSVTPGNDFFRFANGTWLDSHAIPADKPAVTLRLEMTDRTEARLHDMLEASAAKVSHQPSDLEGKAGAFYKAFMDEARIEQLGAKPIAPELAAIRGAQSREALSALMGKDNSDFYGSLYNFGIDVDLKDPKHYAIYLSQGGLGLPDRDYYLQKEFAPAKAKYQAYVAQLLHLIGWKNADAQAKAVVDFETKIADASWTKVQERDLNAVYNPVNTADLDKFAPGFNWEAFLKAAGLSRVDRVIVAEKTAFPKLAAIYGTAPLETLKAWHAFHVADNAAPYLSKAFTDAYFDMHDKTLSGQAQQRVRWKRAITAVSGDDFGVGARFGTFGTLGFGVGELYTAKYFGPDAKAKIEGLVHNLLAAYRVRLQNLDWMGTATKTEAIRKLDTYTIKVGYPDHPRDYSALSITDDDLVGDVRRAGAADWAFYAGRYSGPVDRTDWQMTPQTNDAYNGSLRDIVFPAGILQAPIFDANADPAINYGAVGGVIGHELTHGFDDQGRKIDADGKLRDWWTKDDAAKFEARAKVLGAQYSSFQPLPGVHVNGDLTMGENIADLGGLTLALDAYHASLNGKPAPVIDGLTGDQRVFLGWAQAWRGKVSDDYVKKQVVSDPHSPRQFRVNGPVRNIDAWYASFGVKPDDKLYVAPDKRVHIW